MPVSLLWDDSTTEAALTPVVTANEPVYGCTVVDHDDAPLGYLTGAIVTSYTASVLNRPGEHEVMVPADCPALIHWVDGDGNLQLDYPWVVIHRDGAPVARGYPFDITEDVGTGWVTLRLRDLTGLLGAVTFGQATRVNYLPDGDMEAADTTAWQEHEDATCTKVTTHTLLGTRALSIDGGAGGGWVSQVFDTTTPANSDTLQVFSVSAWMRVDPGDQWPYGIVVRRVYDGGGPGNTDAYGPEYDATNDAGKTGQWVKLQVGPIPVEPDRSGQLIVELYAAPGTTVLWDEVRISRDDNTSATPGDDLAVLLQTMIDHGRTKNDLGFTIRAITTGITLAEGFAYPHRERAEVLASLNDWVGQVDWRYSARRHRLEVGLPGSIGTSRRSLAFGGGWRNEVLSARWTDDEVVTSWTLLRDQDDGVTADNGSYVVPDAAILRERVESGPPRAMPKELDLLAEAKASRSARPAASPTVRLAPPSGGRTPGDWIELVNAGDRVPVNNGGRTPWNQTYTARLMSLVVRPVDGDAVDIELAEEL